MAGRPEGESKIDKSRLAELLRDGKTNKTCAQEFGVSVSAIKAARKRIKDLILSPPKNHIGGDNIDAIKQLSEINAYIIKELNRCDKLISREELKVKSVDALEEKLKTNPDDKETQELMAALVKSEIKGILAIQSNIIGISSEIRKQIDLQLKIAEALYGIQMTADFQNEIIGIIKDSDPIVAQKLIARLRERRSLKGLVRINPV